MMESAPAPATPMNQAELTEPESMRVTLDTTDGDTVHIDVKRDDDIYEAVAGGLNRSPRDIEFVQLGDDVVVAGQTFEDEEIEGGAKLSVGIDDGRREKEAIEALQAVGATDRDAEGPCTATEVMLKDKNFEDLPPEILWLRNLEHLGLSHCYRLTTLH